MDRAAPLGFDLLLRELVVLRSQRLRILGFLRQVDSQHHVHRLVLDVALITHFHNQCGG